MTNLLAEILEFTLYWGPTILEAIGQTFSMVGLSLFWSLLLGFPLAIVLVLTRPQGKKENRYLYKILNALINMLRSLPFIILLFFLIPVTKFLTGTIIGVKGAVVPLLFYCAPYLARLIESSLLEVDDATLEAYEAMGIPISKIVFYVWIPEAKASLILSLTTAVIGLIGATAMAGLVGAGGLGDVAYRFGFQRFEPSVMTVTVILLILLVQGIQALGNHLSSRARKDQL